MTDEQVAGLAMQLRAEGRSTAVIAALLKWNRRRLQRLLWRLRKAGVGVPASRAKRGRRPALGPAALERLRAEAGRIQAGLDAVHAFGPKANAEASESGNVA